MRLNQIENDILRQTQATDAGLIGFVFRSQALDRNVFIEDLDTGTQFFYELETLRIDLDKELQVLVDACASDPGKSDDVIHRETDGIEYNEQYHAKCIGWQMLDFLDWSKCH
jgi:hypothetical protein